MTPTLQTIAGLYQAALEMQVQADRAMKTVMECAKKNGLTQTEIIEAASRNEAEVSGKVGRFLQ